MATVTLTRPITRGETTIASVTLREPAAGDMRGLNLLAVMQMDVSALITLIPRISIPKLDPNEVDGMGAADITRLGMAVVGFFNGVPETGPDTPTT